MRVPDFGGPTIIVCSAESKAACLSRDGICLPRLQEGDLLCVFKKGDVPCEGAWTGGKRFTFYAGFEDSRDCTPCACEAAKVDLGANGGKGAPTACGTPSGGKPIGALTMTDLSTACCR
jgi:hypothetical protein